MRDLDPRLYDAWIEESSARTLRAGRWLAGVAFVVLSYYVVLDQTVLQVPGLSPWRLTAILPSALYLIAALRVLPRRRGWILPAHVVLLTSIMVEAVIVSAYVLVSRPPVAGFEAGAVGAIFIGILGVFACAADARRLLPWIIFIPIAGMLTVLALRNGITPDEYLLFIDPLVAGVVVSIVAYHGDRATLDEFRSRQLANGHEEELARSNEDLRRFAHVVSHDLKQPLRGISGYLDLIARHRRGEEQSGDDITRFVSRATLGAERMRRLIDDMLSYASVDSAELRSETVDLGLTVQRALEDLRALVDETSAQVDADDLPTVKGDPEQLVRLFANLLSNALKYRRPGVAPHVRITAERRRNSVVLFIADNGIGISPKDQESVFEVFTRLHTEAEVEGTGIGLATCKRIVDHHRGDIHLESTPGTGTTFVVELPAAYDSRSQSAIRTRNRLS